MTTYQLGLTALADPSRRAIVERLAEGPQSVASLAAELPISRPATSQHLKVLLEAGLVSCRSEGTRNLYRLDPEGLDAIRRYLDRFWTRSLAAFAREAEQIATPEKP